MPDSKITALTSISTSTDPANDPLVIVDVSDTSMAATGTTKKVTLNQLLATSPTATLASATISGDLTVDTSTLKVDSANDRVGVGTASPAAGAKLGVLGATSVSTSDYIGSSTWAARFIASSNGASSGISFLTNSASGFPTPASIHATPIADYRSALVLTYSADSSGAGYFAVNRSNPIGSNTLEHYKIDNAGVATWSNVGGVAGTAMTLNSTGLGVGNTPVAALDVYKVANDTINRTNATFCFGQIAGLGAALLGQQSASAPYQFNLQAANAANSVQFPLVLQPSGGNVGIGVTPTYKLQSVGIAAATSLTVNGSGGNLIGALLNSDDANSGVNPGVDLRRWTGTALNHGLTYIATNATGDTLFYNGTAASNTRATSLKMTLDASGNLLVGKTTGVNKLETVGAGVDGRGTVTGVSTVATTIYTIKQSATAAMCVVFGDNGTDGFCDIVLFLATVAPKVVSSQTLYGSPAARTYSASTTNLQLALASGTLSIRTAALSTLNT